MMIQRLFLLLLSGLVFSAAFTQPDTLISYEVATGIIDTLPPVPIDSSVSFVRTSSFPGTVGGAASVLSQFPPDTLVFPNTQLSRLSKAAEQFDLTSYPLRTSVKIMAFLDGDTTEDCSGILVGDRWVLSSADCFFRAGEGWVYDSLLVFPAFDSGEPQGQLPISKAEKYYCFLSFVQDSHDPIALIELADPIGAELGWAGIGFQSDSSFYTQTNFHKLSYVREALQHDSSFLYTNDTLYYNYGRLKWLSPSNFTTYSGDLGTNAYGLNGQLGSPFFYTDSLEAADAIAVAIFTYAGNYRHYRIKREVFFPFASLLGGPILNVEDSLNSASSVQLFPNPVETVANLTLGEHRDPYRIQLWTLDGRLVHRWKNIYGETWQLERGQLATGIYLLEIHSPSRHLGTIKVWMK